MKEALIRAELTVPICRFEMVPIPPIVYSCGVLFQSIPGSHAVGRRRIAHPLRHLSVFLLHPGNPARRARARSDCCRFVFVDVTSIFQSWRGNKWADRQIGVRNSGYLLFYAMPTATLLLCLKVRVNLWGALNCSAPAWCRRLLFITLRNCSLCVSPFYVLALPRGS